jgi:hypothetical protein
MPGHVGWIRTRGRPWTKAVESTSYDDAVAELLRHADRLPDHHKDLVVLPIGQLPAVGRRRSISIRRAPAVKRNAQGVAVPARDHR